MPHAPNANSRRRSLAALAALGLALGGTAALAQTVGEVTVTGRVDLDTRQNTLSRAVSYADLDLSTRAGAEIFERRIRDTVQLLCAELTKEENLASLKAPCERQALDDALPRASLLIDDAKAAARGGQSR